MPLPQGSDVAAYLGRTQDAGFLKQCDSVVGIVYEQVRSYCREHGFEDDEDVPKDLASVIVTAAARLATNPTVLAGEQAEAAVTSSGPDGFYSRSELAILHRYRRRVA